MKTNRLLRVLSLLGFLLLMAPFYDSCNKRPSEVAEKAISSHNSTPKETTIPLFDSEALTGFEIANLSFMICQEATFKELKNDFLKSFQKKGWYKDLGFYISVLFDFNVLISFSILMLSFTKRITFLNKLALINSILAITTFLYIISLERSFEHWSQIKWGYYAFIITNLLLFYYSKKRQIPTELRI